MADSKIKVESKAEKEETEASKKQAEEAEAIQAKIKEDKKKAEEARAASEKKKKEEEEAAEKKAAQEKKKEEEEAKKEKEEAKKKEAQNEALSEGLVTAGLGAAAAVMSSAKSGKGGIGSFLIGLVAGLVAGALGCYLLVKMPMTVGTLEPAESHDVVIEDHGVLGYTAADFADAVLGAASEHQELIVMEQPLSIATTITQAGLGNFAIFSKIQNVTYHGTGVFTVNLKNIDSDHISVDEDTRTVTVSIPHAELQYVNPDLDAAEFQDTEKGLLAFGDLKLTLEEQNALEQSIDAAMRERLTQDDIMSSADNLALLKTYEIFQPLISAVSAEYTVEMVFVSD